MRELIEQLEDRKLLSGIEHLGDANSDDHVDSSDFVILAQHFGQTTVAGASLGDFNTDGIVNSLDFNLLATNFGAVMATIAWANDAGHTDVNDDAAWVGGVKPGASDVINFGTPSVAPDADGGLGTVAGLIVVNGNELDPALNLGFLSGLVVSGNVSITGCGELQLQELGGNLTASSMIGSVSVNNFTGTAKTISCTAGHLNLAAATVPASYLLTVSGGGTIVNYTQSQSWVVTGGATTQLGSVAIPQGRLDSGFGGEGSNGITAIIDTAGADIEVPASTDTTSTFSLSGVSPGTYTLRFTDLVNSIQIDLPNITITSPSNDASNVVTQQQQLIRRHHYAS